MAEVTELDNGLVILTENLPDFNSATVMIDVGVGSADETKATGGISHVIEHMLFKGTDTRNRLDIVNSISNVGGYFNAYTSNDNTRYYANVPKTHVYTALDVISDMVLNSKLDADELSRELEVIKQELVMYEDDPGSKCDSLHDAFIYDGNPYAEDIGGYADIVGGFKREDLLMYMKKHYSPGRTIVACIGSVDHDEFVAEVKSRFEDIEDWKTMATHSEYGFSGGINKHHNPDLDQVGIRISFKGPNLKAEDDGRLLQFALTELGGGMSSRLFQNVRDERGLAYHVSTRNHALSKVGDIRTYIGTSEDKVVEAVEATLFEIRRMREEGLTANEVNTLKERMIGSFQMSQDSLDARANSVMRQIRYRDEVLSVEQIVRRIRESELEDINLMIQRWFPESLDDIAITLYGPCEKVDLSSLEY